MVSAFKCRYSLVTLVRAVPEYGICDRASYTFPSPHIGILLYPTAILTMYWLAQLILKHALYERYCWRVLLARGSIPHSSAKCVTPTTRRPATLSQRWRNRPYFPRNLVLRSSSGAGSKLGAVSDLTPGIIAALEAKFGVSVTAVALLKKLSSRSRPATLGEFFSGLVIPVAFGCGGAQRNDPLDCGAPVEATTAATTADAPRRRWRARFGPGDSGRFSGIYSQAQWEEIEEEGHTTDVRSGPASSSLKTRPAVSIIQNKLDSVFEPRALTSPMAPGVEYRQGKFIDKGAYGR